ncbi:MAG: energy transducer TonB [Bacteroidia bacterium]|nr:energy transducer TonB [Bacteroidia bacterium]
MELKKSKKADLEIKRGLFLQIGMFVSLAIVLFAFTYTEKVTKAESLGQVAALEISEEMVPITRQEEVKLPSPPPPPAAVEILNIVADDTKINDKLEIMDSEATKDTKVEVAFVQITTEEKEKVEEEIFVVVENMPVFPGGNLALRKYIATSIKYPTLAQENGIQGKVFVNFVVDKDGSVSNAKIARGVDPSIDKEALRVIMSLPKWQPGMQRGKPVRVTFTVPINFQLQ